MNSEENRERKPQLQPDVDFSLFLGYIPLSDICRIISSYTPYYKTQYTMMDDSSPEHLAVAPLRALRYGLFFSPLYSTFSVCKEHLSKASDVLMDFRKIEYHRVWVTWNGPTSGNGVVCLIDCSDRENRGWLLFAGDTIRQIDFLPNEEVLRVEISHETAWIKVRRPDRKPSEYAYGFHLYKHLRDPAEPSRVLHELNPETEEARNTATHTNSLTNSIARRVSPMVDPLPRENNLALPSTSASDDVVIVTQSPNHRVIYRAKRTLNRLKTPNNTAAAAESVYSIHTIDNPE